MINVLIVVIICFIFYLAYAIYVCWIYPAHKKITNSKLIDLINSLDSND